MEKQKKLHMIERAITAWRNKELRPGPALIAIGIIMANDQNTLTAKEIMYSKKLEQLAKEIFRKAK